MRSEFSEISWRLEVFLVRLTRTGLESEGGSGRLKLLTGAGILESGILESGESTKRARGLSWYLSLEVEEVAVGDLKRQDLTLDSGGESYSGLVAWRDNERRTPGGRGRDSGVVASHSIGFSKIAPEINVLRSLGIDPFVSRKLSRSISSLNPSSIDSSSGSAERRLRRLEAGRRCGEERTGDCWGLLSIEIRRGATPWGSKKRKVDNDSDDAP